MALLKFLILRLSLNQNHHLWYQLFLLDYKNLFFLLQRHDYKLRQDYFLLLYQHQN